MKKVRLIALISTLASLSCGGSQDSGLSANIVPSSPVFIDAGTNVTIGGVSVTPGYFVMSSMTLNWTGSNSVSILDINFTAIGNQQLPFTCDISGDALTAAFANNIVGGSVVLTAGSSSAPTVAASTALIYCDSITVPTPVPNAYNQPVRASIEGAAFDSSGNTTGRVKATANITLQ